MTLHTPTPLAGSLEAMDDDDPRLSLLFDDRAAILVDSADGAVVYANPAAAVLFGVERADQLSDDPEILRGPGLDRLRTLGQLRTLGKTLAHRPDGMSAPIEMLRFFIGPRTVSQGFSCSRIPLAAQRNPHSETVSEPHMGILAVSVCKIRPQSDIASRAETLFGQSPDPAIVRDRNGMVVYRNPAADRLDDPEGMHSVERQAGDCRISFPHRPALDRIAQSNSTDEARNAETRAGRNSLEARAGVIRPGGATADAPSGMPDIPAGPETGTRFRFSLDQNAEVSDAVPALNDIGLLGGVGSEMDDLVAGDPTQLACAIEARDTFNRILIQWHAADDGAPFNILLSGLPILDGEGGFHGLRAFGVIGSRAAAVDLPLANAGEPSANNPDTDDVTEAWEATAKTDRPELAVQTADDDPEDETAEGGDAGDGVSRRLGKRAAEGACLAVAGAAAGGAAAGLIGKDDVTETVKEVDGNAGGDNASRCDRRHDATSTSTEPTRTQRPMLISVKDTPVRRPMRPTEETFRPANGLARSDQEALDEIAERLSAEPVDHDMDADTDTMPGHTQDDDVPDLNDVVQEHVDEFADEHPGADDETVQEDDGDRVLVPFSRQRGGARIASAATALGGLGADLGMMSRSGNAASEDNIGDGGDDARRADATNGITDLIDRLPLGMLFVRDEIPLYANRAFLDLFGYADIGDLVAEGGVPTLFENLSDTQVPGKRMLTGITRDNRPFQVEARLQMARWVDGPAVLLSIRERDRFDTRPLENADAEIAELRDVLDAVPDAILVTDNAGLIRALNATARDLLGPLDRAAQPPFLPTLFAGDDRDRIAGIIDQITSEDAADRPAPILATLIARSGEQVEFDTALSLIGIGLREKICAVLRRPGMAADMDAAGAGQDLVSADSGKPDALAKVSHEIRTPINAIIGFADMMLDEQYGPIGHERYAGYLRDIKSSGMHIISLVNDLLDLSKVEAGMLDLEFAETRLNDVVEQCTAIMQSQANRDNVILRTSIAQNLPPVVADIRSIRQILLNLLSNAIKFTDAGGQVIVSTIYNDDGTVGLRVRDTGTGMSEEDITRALEPYRQNAATVPDHPNRGSGIGLPLTRALADANRAHFSIDSTPGDGTTVHVSFPSTRVLSE